jgi:glutathione synthase/RimK-type ligase-like ATP-grasp enzyme
LVATDQLGSASSVSLRLDASGEARLTLTTRSGWSGSGDDIGAVWNRRRIVNPGGTDEGTDDPLADQYIREQSTHLLDNLVCLDGAHWVNPPLSLRRARPKFHQLTVARRHGLVVPPTLCSDDPAAIREFAAAIGGRLVTKVVSPGTPLVPNREHQYMVFTQPFDAALVEDGALSAAPAIYQARVEKAFDARVVVIGDQFFGCLIASQEADDTSLDWRRYQTPHVRHSIVEVPEPVRAGLTGLHREYGLRYSASDFSVTGDGQWVFLELNPNGQWGWLEEETRAPIGRALAEELARGLAR